MSEMTETIESNDKINQSEVAIVPIDVISTEKTKDEMNTSDLISADKVIIEYDKICLMCHSILPTTKSFTEICRVHRLCPLCILAVHSNSCNESTAIKALDTAIFSHMFGIDFGDLVESTLVSSTFSPDDFYLDPDYVTDNIHIGCTLSSTSLIKMKEFGITHVVAVGNELKRNFPDDFMYYSIDIIDDPSQRIDISLDDATEFIHKAVHEQYKDDKDDKNDKDDESKKINKNKVLVHCVAGISRSATVVTAYLIRYKQMSLNDALIFLRGSRHVVNPNLGFLNQLKEYEKKYSINP
jgi:protein-tyrosine phosphatase